jgi:conjugative transposon protein TcpC
MVRRSTLDRGPQSDVHDGGSGLRTPDYGQQPDATDGPPEAWRGAGRRWMVWAGRGLLWLVLIIIGVRGVIAIALNQTTPSKSSGTSASAPASTSSFPSSLAEAYALQFASVYLNFSQATASQRATQLGIYMPNAPTAQAGWNGAGSLTLESDQVAGINVVDSQHAVVTILAQVNGKLMELGVPIYASGGGMTVSSEPAWLAAPAQATVPAPAEANPDLTAQNALQTQLPSFFQAYANGDTATMARFLARGASVTGLGGAVSYQSISALYVPAGGDTRQITVTVTWQLPGAAGSAPAQLQMTYDMTVVNQNSSWYVQSIRASDQPVQPQS